MAKDLEYAHVKLDEVSFKHYDLPGGDLSVWHYQIYVGNQWIGQQKVWRNHSEIPDFQYKFGLPNLVGMSAAHVRREYFWRTGDVFDGDDNSFSTCPIRDVEWHTNEIQYCYVAGKEIKLNY